MRLSSPIRLTLVTAILSGGQDEERSIFSGGTQQNHCAMAFSPMAASRASRRDRLRGTQSLEGTKLKYSLGIEPYRDVPGETVLQQIPATISIGNTPIMTHEIESAHRIVPVQPITLFGPSNAGDIMAAVQEEHRYHKRRHEARGRRHNVVDDQHAVIPPMTTTTALIDIPQSETQWTPQNVRECVELWDLSPKETLMLTTLRDSLTDLQHPKNNPYEVVRFLKEFGDDVSTVERKFRKMIEWRLKHNVDSILIQHKDKPPKIQESFPAGVLEGVDNDGDPIHLERTGSADATGIHAKFGLKAMYHHAIWLREIQSHGRWHREYEKAHGHPIKQFTVVLDMGGLSVKSMSPSLVALGQKVGRLVQDYYPGYTKRVIFLNSPSVFRFAFNRLTPFLSKKMKEKIVFLDKDPSFEQIGQYLDVRLLPKELCPGKGQGRSVAEFNTNWQGIVIEQEK